MNLTELNKELSSLTNSSKPTFDIKVAADNKGVKVSKKPFGLDVELLGGSRPRFCDI